MTDGFEEGTHFFTDSDRLPEEWYGSEEVLIIQIEITSPAASLHFISAQHTRETTGNVRVLTYDPIATKPCAATTVARDKSSSAATSNN